MVFGKVFSVFAALAGSLVLPPMASASVQAQGRPALYAACLAEAKRPLMRSPAYRNGSVRDREVLANSYVPSVRRGENLCLRANTAPSPAADADCGPAQSSMVADDHAQRLGALCRALAALPR